MQAERWERLQRVFDEATQRPEAERDRFVDSECGDDEELKSEVRAMIAADESAGEFIEDTVRGATTSFATDKDPTRELTKFGKYEILGWIGEGGFSQVHKGRDPMLQRVVAIKTCTSASRDIRRRFYREATIAAGLQHPNIVTVHDLGVENGVPFLVQEFLSGEDLATKLAKEESISPSTAVDYLIQVARGLEYAHDKGVLHRDIKPSNIQALNSGRIKILDFGIARFLEDENPLTDQGTPIGTAGYQSPEQLEGLELDRRTDIFSFGVLAYELVASTRPFPGKSFAEVYHRVLNEQPVPLRRRVRGCPPALEALVGRCLENRRDRRPKDFTHVIAALEEVAAVLPPPTKPGAALSTHDVLARRRPRQLPPIAWASLAAILATGVLLWSLGRRPTAPEPPTETTTLSRSVPRATGAGAPRGSESASPEARPAVPGGAVAAHDGTAATVDSDSATVIDREELPMPTADRRPAAPSRSAATPTAVVAPTADTSPAGSATDPLALRGTPDAGSSPSTGVVASSGSAAEPAAGDPVANESATEEPAAQADRTLPVQVDRSIWEETAPPVRSGAAEPSPTPPPSDHPSEEEEIGPVSAWDPTPPEEVAPSNPGRSESGAGLPAQRTLAEQPPELLEKLTLIYPSRISAKQRVQLQREKSIRITMQVLVDEDGYVRQASVRNTNEPGGTAFQDAAKAVVLQARFRPGMRDGEPEPMWTLLSLEYPLP